MALAQSAASLYGWYRCIAVVDGGGGFRSGDFFRFFCGVRGPGLRFVTGRVTRFPRGDCSPVDQRGTGPRIRMNIGLSDRVGKR